MSKKDDWEGKKKEGATPRVRPKMDSLPSFSLSLTHTRTHSLSHTHALALDERLVLAKKSVKRLVSFFGGGDVWFSQLLATASVLSLSGIGSLGRIGSLGSGRHRQPLATTPGLKKGINVQTLQL